MKLLLDSCVWGGCLGELRISGHEVEWAGRWDKDPGDREILHIAHNERRVLVTLDKDFGERAIVFGESHSGIIRLVGISARRQAGYISLTLKHYGDELLKGGIATVDTQKTRIRSPI